jgi:hypothetical protein
MGNYFFEKVMEMIRRPTRNYPLLRNHYFFRGIPKQANFIENAPVCSECP